jgi:hypothetical protein
MGAEVLSKETLVVWISYTLIDNAVRKHHRQLMQPFGVSLNYEDLQHLVLCDKLFKGDALAWCR